MVAMPGNDLEGTVARVDRKLPNEATIMSRILKVTTRWFGAVRAIAMTPIDDHRGDRCRNRSKTTKRSHDYIEIAGNDDGWGSRSQSEGSGAER